ncbi:MAG: hypothetical protein ABI665_04235 [Vicinamibacterales bacterium]
MRRALILFASCLALSGAAQAQNTVRVLETWPASPATLARSESFNLRIHYEAPDRVVRVRAEAFFQGQRVPGINSGSPEMPPGSGEALFWFAYDSATRVDRIVVRLDGPRGDVLGSAELPVDLTWTGAPDPQAPKPGWVTTLEREQNERISDELKQFQEGPLMWFGTALIAIMPMTVIAFVLLQGFALWKWRGKWRIAALASAIPMALVVAYTVYAAAAGSNLFPLVLLFASPPALVYLLVLFAIKRLWT